MGGVVSEPRDGWHRLIARDGQVAVMLVSSGRPVELVVVGRSAPPYRPSRRFVGTVEQVRRRRELQKAQLMLAVYGG